MFNGGGKGSALHYVSDGIQQHSVDNIITDVLIDFCILKSII